MADIFLSYAKEDREVARKLSALLEKAGWSVWWDRRIPAGRTWHDVLEDALREMHCMVVLWSSHSRQRLGQRRGGRSASAQEAVAGAELGSARATDPGNAEVRAEIEETKRACLAEKRLGRSGLDCY